MLAKLMNAKSICYNVSVSKIMYIQLFSSTYWHRKSIFSSHCFQLKLLLVYKMFDWVLLQRYVSASICNEKLVLMFLLSFIKLPNCFYHLFSLTRSFAGSLQLKCHKSFQQYIIIPNMPKQLILALNKIAHYYIKHIRFVYGIILWRWNFSCCAILFFKRANKRKHSLTNQR